MLEESRRAVIKAARKGDVEEVARLVRCSPADLMADDEGIIITTPLMEAARHNHVKVAGLVLDHGALVDTLDMYTWSALMHACHEGHVAVVKQLLKRGADPTIRSCFDWDDGHTSIMIAARRGHAAVVRTLLQAAEHSIEVDEVNDEGQTALFMACFHGHEGTARVLLMEGGADPSIVDKDGKTAMQVADEQGHHACVELLQWLEDEKQRAYVLHKARAVADDAITREDFPEAPLPAYITRPLAQAMPKLHLISPIIDYIDGSGAMGAGAATRVSGVLAGEEERAATLGFVMEGMLPELYEELLHGLQMGVGICQQEEEEEDCSAEQNSQVDTLGHSRKRSLERSDEEGRKLLANKKTVQLS